MNISLEYRLALAAGFFAGLVQIAAYKFHIMLLAPWGGAILLSTVVLMRIVPAIVAIGIFSLAALFTVVDDPTNVIRIVLFSLSLLFLKETLKNSPPFYLLIALWLAFFVFAPGYLPGHESYFLDKLHWTVIIGITEVMSVLFVGIVSCTNTATQLVGSKPHELGARPFFIQILSLVAIVSVVIASSSFMALGNASGETVLHFLLIHKIQSGVVLAALLLVPILLGLMLAQIIDDFSLTAQRITRPEHSIMRGDEQLTPIRELRNCLLLIAENTNQLFRKYRTVQTEVKDLEERTKAREKRALEREINAFNLMHLMNRAPWGCVAISANGTIIQANNPFCETFELEQGSLDGHHYSEIACPHPWSHEVVAILEWACREHENLVGQSSFRFYSSTVDQQYLEINVHSSFTADSRLVMKQVEHRPLSNVSVTLFFRTIPDLRDFQLDTISPYRRDIVGHHAIIAAGKARENLQKLAEDLETIKTTVLSLQKSTQVHTLHLVAQNMEKLTEDCLRALLGADDPSIDKEALEDIDFAFYLQQCLNHLYDMLQLGQRAKVINSDDPAPADNSALPEGPGPLVIRTSRQELSKAMAHLLALLKSMLPRAPHLDVEVGLEHIGTNTAQILPTQISGEYLRVEIKHASQTITQNMTLRTFADLSQESGALNQTEMAIALLSFQIRRLGGFISVQSSASKGTLMTIYLPQDFRYHLDRALERAERRLGHRNTMLFEHNALLPQLLLVSAEGGEIPPLTKMLTNLGYQITVEDPETILEEASGIYAIGGEGFGPDDSTALSDDSNGELNLELRANAKTRYQSIIVNVTSSIGNFDYVLEQLIEMHPLAKVILLVDRDAEQFEKLDQHKVVGKPVEIGELKAAIDECLEAPSTSQTQTPTQGSGKIGI